MKKSSLVFFAMIMGALAPGVARAESSTMTSESRNIEGARVVVGIERAVSGGYTYATDDRFRASTPYPHGGVGVRGPWAWNDPAATYSFRAPRLAVDVGALSPWTFGVSAFWFAPSGRAVPDKDSFMEDVETNATVWGVAPRVGLRICDHDRLCFWPRVGVMYSEVSARETIHGSTYAGVTPATELHYDYRNVAVSLEPTLVVGIVPHFALTATALLDYALLHRSGPAGTFDNSKAEYDGSTTNIALSVGAAASW